MRKKLAAMLLAAVMTVGLLPLSACSGDQDTTATTMRLRRAEGTVVVSNGGGKDVPLLDNLGLYSGYGVGTQSMSYAWIDLDDVKLTKLDQNSEISIEKDGKKLDIELKSGSLYFNVTQPLEDDETMNIRASTMLVGIRGTSGWVNCQEDRSQVYLLEGKVECSAEDQTVRVSAGEMAELTQDGELTVKEFYEEDLPAFIQDEVNLELPAAPEDTPTPEITEAPEPSEPPGPAYRYPTQTLSGSHKTFLDKVWAAMSSSDLDTLKLLARDDAVRRLVAEVIAPYAQRLAEEYEELSYLLDGEAAGDPEDGVSGEGGRYTGIYYDGEVLCAEILNQVTLNILYEKAEDEQTLEKYADTEFLLVNHGGDDDETIRRRVYEISDSSRYRSGELVDQTYLIWRDEYLLGGYTEAAAEKWTLISQEEVDYGDGNGLRRAEMQIRGEFRMTPEEDGPLRACLENGQVTLSCSAESGLSGAGTIGVTDGYVDRQDDVCWMENPDGIWRVSLEIGDLVNHHFYYFVNYGQGGAQNGSLYHLFDSFESWSYE